ncbi:MAG TPA: N-6 DNA methylase [Acidimicrobiia bacterium]|nr:N-6 DNA methylase [Acidimicrobiia bacterium]
MTGVHEDRSKLGVLHRKLRNEGYNPLEAIGVVAKYLQWRTDGEQPSGIADRVLESLHSTLDDVEIDAGFLAVLHQDFLLPEARNGLGQYLTPMPVASLIASIIATRRGSGLALDPFCGTGLLLDTLGIQMPRLDLLGVEINPTVADIARTLSVISPRRVAVRSADVFEAWADDTLPMADVIVTNPPFGAAVTSLSHDDLASLLPAPLMGLRTLPVELMGLELSVNRLEPGGVIGIVLPQSVLTNETWSAYRADVFRRLDLRDVVSLPEETFAPFKGVARSCVLFGIKRSTSLPVTFSYRRSTSVGYDSTGRVAEPSDLNELSHSIVEGLEGPTATVDEQGRTALPLRGIPTGQSIRLGDIATLFTGRNPAREQYVAEGPYLLKVGDLTGSFIAWSPRGRSHIPEDWFSKQNRLHLKEGDICLTSAAHRPRYIGLKVDLIDSLPGAGAMPSGEVMVIRLDPNCGVYPEELLFFLRSAAGYEQLQDMVRGSTAHLYARDVRNLRLAPPDLSKRDQIRAMFAESASAFRWYIEVERELTEIALGKQDSSGLIPDR